MQSSRFVSEHTNSAMFFSNCSAPDAVVAALLGVVAADADGVTVRDAAADVRPPSGSPSRAAAAKAPGSRVLSR